MATGGELVYLQGCVEGKLLKVLRDSTAARLAVRAGPPHWGAQQVLTRSTTRLSKATLTYTWKEMQHHLYIRLLGNARTYMHIQPLRHMHTLIHPYAHTLTHA